MSPTVWFKIYIRGRKRIFIPLPLFLILPIILCLEILAILPVGIYCIKKREYFPIRMVSRLYFSRLIFMFMLHGGGFRINIREDRDTVLIGG